MSEPVASCATREESAGRLPLPHPIRNLLCDAIIAVSLANLCLVSAWFPTLFDAYQSYFNKLPVTRGMLLALLGEWVCVAFLVWVGMRALRLIQQGWLRLVLHLLFLGSLLLPLDFIRVYQFSVADYQILLFLRRPVVGIAVLAILVFVIWQHRLVARIFGVLVGILFPLSLMIFARILLLLLGVQRLALQPGEHPLAPLLPTHPAQPRVIWLLFDETDERLGFEQRPTKVKLPEFDRLRSECLFATNALPPGDRTLQSIPGLIAGRSFSNVEVENIADLKVTLAESGATSLWSQQPCVFTSARNLGVNIALVGWYHPYDRLFRASVSSCAWHALSFYEPERAPTLLETVKRQFGCLTSTMHIRHLYVQTCREILPEALAVATNNAYGLVYLHLPPPHKPGVWLPDKQRYTIYGMRKRDAYFNNLALADIWLGVLRHALEQTGLWDRTWVILSTDHSWRESRVYDGRRDLRVPFFVKPPGGCHADTYSAPFSTALTHDLILAILRGELINQKDVVCWLDTHRTHGQPPLNESEGEE